MPRLTINGEQIAYRDEGTGPPVMLVHSLGTSLQIWDNTVNSLAQRFRVVAFDCRGHGESTNRGGFSIDAIAADALALATSLGLSGFHYVGISMGGLFGVTAYAKAPKSVLSLTLADSYATSGPAGPPRIAATRETLKTVSMHNFAEAYVRDTLMPATPRPIFDRTVEAIAGMSVDNYLQTLTAILTADITPLLPKIRVPTLVIVGERDQRTPVTVSETLVAAIGGAALVVVPEAGHLSVLDQPERFNRALADFLDGGQNKFDSVSVRN